jgi:hypothetical protein
VLVEKNREEAAWEAVFFCAIGVIMAVSFSGPTVARLAKVAYKQFVLLLLCHQP